MCKYLTAAEVGVGHGVARVLAHGQDEVQPRALILALQRHHTTGHGCQELLTEGQQTLPVNSIRELIAPFCV
jgi:hypothetical protein